MKHFALLVLVALAACHPKPEPTRTKTWALHFDERMDDIVAPELVVDELNKIWAPMCVMFDAFEGDITRHVDIVIEDKTSVIGHAYVGGDAVVNAAHVLDYPEHRRARLLAILISHEMGHSYGLPHSNDVTPKPWDGCDIMYHEFWGICSEHAFSPDELNYLVELINVR